MSDIVIADHDFEKAKREIKKFSENVPQRIRIPEVTTVNKGWLWDSDHKVSGYELNDRLQGVNNAIIEFNNFNVKIVKEFRSVYDAFEALDKDYVKGILSAVKSAEKASDEAIKASNEAKTVGQNAKETSDKLDKVVDVLSKSVTKIIERLDLVESRKTYGTETSVIGDDKVTYLEKKFKIFEMCVVVYLVGISALLWFILDRLEK